MIDPDLLPKPKASTAVSAPIRVVETVTVTPLPSGGSADLVSPAEDWTWEQARDYVVRNIEKYHGPFPRNMKTEHSIFKSFCSRWGNLAGPILQAAFTVEQGMWKGSPITINRLCKNSDAYFAEVIAERFR